MLIGYARVSTQDQNLEMQEDALKAAGCERIFRDHASGSRDQRPGLDEALDYARTGDTIVVWRLDRLGRSIGHLIGLVAVLEKHGVGLRSLGEAIDTSDASGRLIFHIFGALAEFERNLIRERTAAGLRAARARGRVGGRPRKLGDAQVKMLYRLHDDGTHSVIEICRAMGISRPTFYDYLKKRKREKA